MALKLPTHSTSLRIASLPGRPVGFDGIPYINLFYDALCPYDIKQTVELLPSADWLGKNHKNVDIVHLHWPEKIWRGEFTSFHRHAQSIRGYYYFRKCLKPLLFPLGFLDLRSFLESCRTYSKKVVWTVHELEPHSSAGKYDPKGYALMAESSDLIITHSLCARDLFISRHGQAGKVVCMRHGNFRKAYPLPRPRDLVLRELGFGTQLPTVCLLGALRKYKGIELAVEAFVKIKDSVQLIIGGVPFPDFPIDDITSLLAAIPTARILPRALSAQEFADIAGCSDAFLLPYSQITTSGVMHAAFTFGCGIIATKLPYFEEALVEYPLCGCLARTNSADDFAAAILDYFRLSMDQRKEQIQKVNQHSEWDIVIKPVADRMLQWV